MAAPFKVKAVYEYASEETDDLSFPVGQIINIIEVIDADWYEGEYIDASGAKRSGIFPNNFVEKYEPAIPSRPTRPTRPKEEAQPTPPPPAPVDEREPEEEEEEQAPVVPAASKPQPPPVQTEVAPAKEEVRSSPSAKSERTPVARDEPPPAPRPAPAEPAPISESKKKPPPVAPKNNAFKDRIAAFNAPAAAPIAPMPRGLASGKPAESSSFIKKQYVAPPPSSSAYVPPPIKQEPVHKPYIREEDPEIRRRQEEDTQAAEAAGLTSDAPAPEAAEGEDVPKPQSLKERIAALQKQQAEQAQRRVEGGHHTKEKKTPAKKPTEASEHALPAEEEEAEGEKLDRVRSGPTDRQSLDVARDKPRVPSAQRRPAEPMSPIPSAPAHELVSGGEEADQSAAADTSDDDAETIGPKDDEEERPVPVPPPTRVSTAPKQQRDVGDQEDTIGDATAEDEDEETSEDEETRRKRELRERMAKMSGGMGMGAMFGPPGGIPMPGAGGAPKKRTSTRDSKASREADASSPPQAQQRIPMIPVPGMQRVHSPDSSRVQPEVEKEDEPEARSIRSERPPDEVPDMEDVKPEPPPRASTEGSMGGAPPVPRERPVPQAASERALPPPILGDRPTPRPPAAESRPVPPPPPADAPLSPGPGSESDDEMSMHAKRSSAETSGIDTPLPIRTNTGGAPPVPGSRPAPVPPPRSPQNNRTSGYFGSEPPSATSDKRSSRVPPIPGQVTSPTSPRPPPPPPPTAAPPSRENTGFQPPSTQDDERGESDYEGDYDTDIASGVKHKDAVRNAAHVREPSLDESTTGPDDAPVSSLPPPLAGILRAVPPPPPGTTPKARQSMDTPRAPPPMPPARNLPAAVEEDYDPYRYGGDSSKIVPPVPNALPVSAPPIPPPRQEEPLQEESSDDMYSASPPRKSMDRPPPPPPSQDRAPPMPPAPAQAPPPSQPPPARGMPKQSLDVQRTPTMGRRSMEQGRPAGDQGQIATDVDLAQNTQWWTASQPLPPIFQSRNGVDILSESEESTTSKRGGRTTISKDIYILFIDYSQTVITARYDSREPADVSLEQRHEPSPPKLRQDQLESFWQRFGAKVADAANSIGHNKKESSLGDGSPTSLVNELIKSQQDALLPVGARAYGALVYANLANASVMQFDEIRAGDVVTLRNAKFEGKHSGLGHQKYRQDFGAGHVALVSEWDGTKKKIRAWEQGREKKGGVRSESFRLGDLKSGEVRVWRVVGREWVGWN